MTDNGNELCEGMYAWDGNNWTRLGRTCGCDYIITGWQNGTDYHILCQDFSNVDIYASTNICKTAENSRGYTYHLMTNEEYQQIWSQPVKGASDYKFSDDEYYYVYVKSNTSSPLGWVTLGTQNADSGGKRRETIGFDQARQNTAPNTQYFPGGLPIGGLIDLSTVRCVRD